jgi:hypothetical protein
MQKTMFTPSLARYVLVVSVMLFHSNRDVSGNGAGCGRRFRAQVFSHTDRANADHTE